MNTTIQQTPFSGQQVIYCQCEKPKPMFQWGHHTVSSPLDGAIICNCQGVINKEEFTKLSPVKIQRLAILNRLESIRKQQQELEQEEIKLCRSYIQLNDEREWYTENERTVGRGKTKRTFIEGRYHWLETFTDEDTGQKVDIERSRPVRENGVWDNIALSTLVL